jgi:hypothetical protein
MPIRPPALDDRKFDDLVAELLARIPAHTPEWTNPRVGDPGRTLIELFAWLGDALLYRANLIPERQRLAFLRLLGDSLRPARAARGIVTLELKDDDVKAYALKPGARFDGPLPFEARREITTLPLTLGAFYKKPAQVDDLEPGMQEALAAIHHQSTGMKLYVTTPLFAGGGPAPEGFDAFSMPSDRCLWLGLFARRAKPEDQAAVNAKTLEALDLAAKEGRPLLNIGFVPALEPSDSFPMTSGAVRSAIPHLWEITVNTNRQAIDETHAWVPEYLALDEMVDTTASLTRAGIVRLAMPGTKLLHAPTNDLREDFNAGVGDRPPRLDDEGLAASLIAWIRLRPKPGAPEPLGDAGFVTEPRTRAPANPVTNTSAQAEHLWVTWLGINALEVEQLTTRRNFVVGESDGTADQEFRLPATSVDAESLELSVEEGDGLLRWRRVEDLAALDRSAEISRDARVFELDAEGGVVRFGDGVRGRIPPAGNRIIVGQVRSGGGEAGNLPAGTLAGISAESLSGEIVGKKFLVRQPLAFTKGENSETLLQAERRIPSRFRHHERAVTTDDYRALALETPGVPVARVEMLPRFKPQQRMDGLPGIVTVMALPAARIGPAPNPRADRPFLEAVHAHLDKRRPLSTELYVIGCEYVPVSITVAVSMSQDAEPNVTEQAIKAALQRVLWPLPQDDDGAPGGGFDGQGWKFSHEISNRELAVEVARVKGVSEVAGLNLFVIDPVSGGWRAHQHASDNREQDVTLQKWQLPELRGVVVVFGESAPLTFDGMNTNPFADDQAVAVPVVPKLC